MSEKSVSNRLPELDKLITERRWKCFIELCELIARMPAKTMLRFKGEQRTVLFVKQSGTVIRIIDTGQEKLNREKIPRRFNPEMAIASLSLEAREKIFQFINDPEVKMEILELPPCLSAERSSEPRSTFAKYL